MKIKYILFSFLYLPLVFAQNQGISYKGNWGGYWWSMNNAETVLGWSARKKWTVEEVNDFTKCISAWTQNCSKFSANNAQDLSPLMKFDLYVKRILDKAYANKTPPVQYTKASENELKIHYIGNNPNHPHYGAASYAGKCIGWALSTFDYQEPTKTIILEGIIFTPADIKAILATIYNGGQFFVPDEAVVGEAYRRMGGTAEAREDVLPKDFILALQKTIGKGRPLVADLDPLDEVWNHPVFSYEIKYSSLSATEITGEIIIGYANDSVPIDAVFSTRPRRDDHLYKTLQFSATHSVNWKENFNQLTTSQWIGRSINQHPDSLVLGLESDWRKKILGYRDSGMNKEVNFQLLKNININRRWISPVDQLIDAYYQAK